MAAFGGIACPRAAARTATHLAAPWRAHPLCTEWPRGATPTPASRTHGASPHTLRWGPLPPMSPEQGKRDIRRRHRLCLPVERERPISVHVALSSRAASDTLYIGPPLISTLHLCGSRHAPPCALVRARSSRNASRASWITSELTSVQTSEARRKRLHLCAHGQCNSQRGQPRGLEDTWPHVIKIDLAEGAQMQTPPSRPPPPRVPGSP